ncbi:MAG: hypothetical protein AB1402_03160 [Bacillota bacterium]
MEKAVRDWIEASFHLDAIRVEDFPLLPAGQMITDRYGATMVVYWDIARERVAWAWVPS